MAVHTDATTQARSRPGRGRLGHRPAELSGGQQQRAAVARALAARPQIVYADEPTGNLDSRAGTEILAFLRQAARELGQAIVMVTHDPVAASYADRVVFLDDGRIVDELTEPTPERVLDRVGCQKSGCHAAYSYSWINPPRRSRRRSRPKFDPLLASVASEGTGVA
jgi:ABC-type glutathione transport system ATPase component